METDRSETQLEGGHGNDNVVPFPRDWIGPAEDLVPLGSPPDEALGEEPGSDEELGRTLGADAFWGECSASLHEAIEAPQEQVVHTEPPDVPEGDAPVRGEVLRARGSGCRQAGPRRGWAGGRSVTAAVAVLVACCAGIAASVAAPGSHSPRTSLAFNSGGQATRSNSSVSPGDARLSQVAVERAIKRFSRRAARRRQASAHHRSPAHRPSRSASRAATFVSVPYGESVSSGASAYSGSSGAQAPGSSVPAPASGGSTSGVAATTSYAPSSSSSDYSSNSSSAAAGPVGAGAPFGPGTASSKSG